MSNRRNSRNANAWRSGSGADDEQHEQEGDDFVPDDAAVIGDAEIAPGAIGRPDADGERGGDDQQ